MLLRPSGLAALLLVGAMLLPFAARAAEETTVQTLCRLIETAADAEGLPRDFFTRLIWRESSFRPHVTSGAGAQGIAQFMPGTAEEQGLDDPFDPELAIPASAKYLRSLKERFGNLGLAAAAYNAGPTRLARWIERGGYLPMETEDYVAFITGRSVQDWKGGEIETLDAPGSPKPDGKAEPGAPEPRPSDPRPIEARNDDPNPARKKAAAAASAEPKARDCVTLVAAIRAYRPSLIEGAYAPFGVQLSGNFSKSIAIASYHRQVARYPSLLEGKPTLILGSRIAGRGRRAFYRVRLPADTLAKANQICNALQRLGGACVVLRN
ncbi:lytic transglycosylase domain-containing protein [Kaistia nematophila]|uniref:Lytic transglycosylase domain-containing protein n=1 Tax=Kaistia nematophila TaxID=2994654 RepID=A0A9X3IKZ3_9HYPH|nr:lytic transglycosylase domain-containing protein [Kaistia nematophila]MCX5568325.1 lytic transglycosylase domain-containing protein [Kaistia nematophila]